MKHTPFHCLCRPVIGRLLTLLTLAAGLAGAADPTLVRVSQRWANPQVAAIGLPTLHGQTVRFATDEAIYEGMQPMVRPVVKASSYIPDSLETWAFFQRDHDRLNYDLPGGDDLIFVGKNPRNEQGIYRGTSSRIIRNWIKPRTQVPEGTGVFERLRYPHAAGEWLVFLGYGPGGQRGVYRARRQEIERIADIQTRVPGKEHAFNEFTYLRVLNDGTVLFTGYSESGSGIYLARQGEGLKTLVDRHTLEPRTRRPYAGALLVGAEDGWAYFTSFGGSAGIGRVRLDAGSIETLVSEETPLGAGSDRLGAVNYASVKGGRILFEAAVRGTEFDLYLLERGVVRPLVRHGDPLEGGTVIGVRCGLESLSPTHYACLVDVDTGVQNPVQRGVYLGRLAEDPVMPVIGSRSAQDPARVSALPWWMTGSPIPVSARGPAPAATNAPKTTLTPVDGRR